MRRIVTTALMATGIGIATLAPAGVALADTPATCTYGVACPQTANGNGGATQTPTAADGTDGADGTSAQTGTVATAASSSLAFTGADVAVTAAGGAGIILVGGLLVRVSRRRSS